MIRRVTLIIGLIAALAPAPSLLAQTALGTLRGVVLDQQGGVLPGVTVAVRQIDTNTVQTTQSVDEGRYVLPNLRPGRWSPRSCRDSRRRKSSSSFASVRT